MKHWFPAMMSVLLLNACFYSTPGAYSVPPTGGSTGSGSTASGRVARPTVKFPASVAVARVEPGHGGFHLISGTDVESDKHQSAARELQGVRGLVSINRTSLASQVKSYSGLDREARALGADVLAVYRFDDGERRSELFAPLTFFSLGLLPTTKYDAHSHVTLMVRDARTGYIYGVLEETGVSGGLTAEMDMHNASSRSKWRARQKALDQMAGKLPEFWSTVVLAKGR